MTGHIILAYEHYMVIVISVLTQKLVHGKHIGLETVIGPTFGCGNQQRPTVLERGIYQIISIRRVEYLHT